MHARRAVFLAASALLLASRGVAQETTSLQLGVTPLEYETEFELGARFSPRGSVGVDCSIDVYPKYLALATLVGVADGSLAANVRLGPLTIEPRVGVSLLGIAGAAGFGGLDGFSAGLGIVLTIDSRTVIRMDYTYRRIDVGEGEGFSALPSLTAGFLLHH